MASNLQYNGLTLQRVISRGFQQEPDWDESQADLLGIKHTISLNTYYTPPGQGTSLGIAFSGLDAAQTCAYIKMLLLQPRKALAFTVNGTLIFYADGNTDTKNGPKPLSCNVTNITGSMLFKIEYVIEATILPCSDIPTNNSDEGVILSNRWEIVENVDDCVYNSRDINGTVVFSKPNGLYLDARTRLIPGLEEGYRRKNISFTRAKDGLSLNYSFSDEEVFASAPDPAFSWECVHRVDYNPGESGSQGLNSFVGSLEVTLRGDPRVNKVELFQVGLTIAEIKLQRDKAGNFDPNTMLYSLSLIDNMNDSSVMVIARVLQSLEAGEKVLENLDESGLSTSGAAEAFKIGRTLDGEGDYDSGDNPWIPYPDGTAAGFFMCAVVGVCDAKPFIASPNSTGSGGTSVNDKDVVTPVSTGTITQNVNLTTGETIAQPVDKVFATSVVDDQRTSVYISYRVDSRYTEELNRAHCAGAERCVVGEFAAPRWKRKVLIDAVRAGAHPPILKHIEYTDVEGIKAIPIGRATISKAQDYTLGGVAVKGITTEMEWALESAPSESAELLGATLPWEKMTPKSVAIPSSAWYDPASQEATKAIA